ncbi:hypothetical protein B9Z55_026915 [Caenorhabditis nigoni]|uniref:F-box domain-containing protein n=1 Tax=Caenorhabditis nigoni TaxID=1611254 RepID=A0A2G5SIA3_9PELO|nr:hypothetical protein B9Z55_026915 [Caenorhabditis nigoni]
MNKSSAVIKNDRYLKTCIKNEVIKKIPIFDSYRKFCNKVGQDAMKYPDFEFWYYRFYHGRRDFNYDRSMDPVPKTIMDIPVKLMYKITENLDPVERAYLRSMNKSIKDIADSHAPIFDSIKIFVSDDLLYWHLNDKLFACLKTANGCEFHAPKGSVIKSDKSIMNKSLEYLVPLFKIPNIQVNHLSLSFYDESVLDGFLSTQFHAKSVKISTTIKTLSLRLLSAMTPGQVESIYMESLHTIDGEIVLRYYETEQFKQAKHIISTFNQFESCELIRDNIRGEALNRTIGLALGAEIPFGPLWKTITHRYQIPKSNEFLEFTIEDKGRNYSIKIFKIR